MLKELNAKMVNFSSELQSILKKKNNYYTILKNSMDRFREN